MAAEVGRRVRKYLIAPEAFLWVLKRKMMITNMFPPDAVGKAITCDPHRNLLELFVESETFPLVPFTEKVPEEILETDIIKVWSH